MKTIQFYESEATDYRLAIKDRKNVGVVMIDRNDHENVSAVTLRAFFEMAGPEALAALGEKLAAALCYAYDKLRADAAKLPQERFTIGELKYFTGLPEDHPEQRMNAFELEKARKFLEQFREQFPDEDVKAA